MPENDASSSRDSAGQSQATADDGASPEDFRAGGGDQGDRHLVWRRRLRRPAPAIIVGVVAVLILAAVGIFVAIGAHSGDTASQSSGSGGAGAPDEAIGATVSASIARSVANVDPAVISAVGTGGIKVSMQGISDPYLSLNGKPEVLFVGGEFCPWCAAERWCLVNALGRFGTFTGLRYMRSADFDGDLATFTFHGARYSSNYVSFVAVEVFDRDQNHLDAVTGAEQRLWNKYLDGSVPFLYLAGRYWQSDMGFQDTVISGESQAQIAEGLKDSANAATEAIIGNANYLTATICKLTFSQPASACNSPAIRRIGQSVIG